MNYKEDITDVLNRTVASMTFPVTILEVTNNTDGTRDLRCSDIFHSQIGFYVSINGNDFLITAFYQETETITIDGIGTITAGDVFEVYTPFFFHGTPVATNTEIQFVDPAQKTPMIWFWENFKTENKKQSSATDRKITVALYALTQPPERIRNLVTDDLYSSCIKPMKRLIERLIKTINEESQTYNTGDGQEYDSENFAIFGVTARNKGSDKALLFDNLSGVSCEMDVELWQPVNCLVQIPEPEGIPIMRINSTFIIQ